MAQAKNLCLECNSRERRIMQCRKEGDQNGKLHPERYCDIVPSAMSSARISL